MSTDENAFKRGTWAGDQWEPSDDDDADGLPIRPGGAGIPEADLQLLELAARAIGAVRIEVVEGENWVNLHFEDRPILFGWNPLQFGGDTFDLAADLGLQVFPVARTTSGGACSAVADCCGRRLSEVTEVLDVRAATRLAVVRAAGKTIEAS